MKKINWNKAYSALYRREKLPRKLKKHILGKRIGRCKLNRMLKTVQIVRLAETMYDFPEIKPHAFCPNCGCTEMRGTGNRTHYPEHWEYFHCLRCNYIVGYIDNSPFIHALECENYNPCF